MTILTLQELQKIRYHIGEPQEPDTLLAEIVRKIDMEITYLKSLKSEQDVKYELLLEQIFNKYGKTLGDLRKKDKTPLVCDIRYAAIVTLLNIGFTPKEAAATFYRKRNAAFVGQSRHAVLYKTSKVYAQIYNTLSNALK